MSLTKTSPAAANHARPSESTFRELVRVLGLIERIMQSYFARFGISGSQWGVLRTLHRAELEGVTGLRLTDLGDRLWVRPPSVTGAIDRLERAGYVTREGSPTDLRTKLVHLTPKARQLVEQVLIVHGEQIDALLGGLRARDQKELHKLLSQLGRHLERMVEDGFAASAS